MAVAPINSPTYLVNKALARRRTIANTPQVLPPAPMTQPPASQLYNFSQVGGLANNARSPLAQDAPGGPTDTSPSPGLPTYPSRQFKLPEPGPTPGADELPSDFGQAGTSSSGMPIAASRPRVVENQPISANLPNDTSVIGNAPTAAEQRLRDLMAKRTELDNTEVQDDDSKLGNFYHGAQYAVRQVQRQGGDLGATFGALIGGGLRGLFNPKEDDQRKLDEDKAQNAKDIAGAEKERDAEIERDYKIAQTRGIPQKIADQEAAHKATAQQKALDLIFKSKYFDPNNPAHQQLAEAAGLDTTELQGWDDRNPVTKQVAGVTYQLNRKTGQYEPTNLPADESKATTDYQVTMPNGELRTYKVAQKDAANFSTQMSALGARLSQQESEFKRRLSLDTDKFNFAKDQFNQTIKLRQQAVDSLNDARIATDANAKARIGQQIKDYDLQIVKLKTAAGLAKQSGELTDDQYNELIGSLPQ